MLLGTKITVMQLWNLLLTVKTLVTLATGNTVLLDRFGDVGFDRFILPKVLSQITLSM